MSAGRSSLASLSEHNLSTMETRPAVRLRTPQPPTTDNPPGEEAVAKDTLDRLLTTLAVRIHDFAMCEIKVGWRLAFDPMEAVTIHYVLAGSGTVRVADEKEAAYSPFSMMVVPARVTQSLGEPGTILGEANAENHCDLLAVSGATAASFGLGRFHDPISVWMR